MIKKHVFALSLALFTASAALAVTAGEVEAKTTKNCQTLYQLFQKTKTNSCNLQKKKQSKVAKKATTTKVSQKAKKSSSVKVSQKAKKPTATKVSYRKKTKTVAATDQYRYRGRDVKVVPTSAAVVPKGKSHSRTIGIADDYVGLSERRHKRQLMGLFGFAFNHRIDPARTPWCAAFANGVLKKSGKSTTGSLTAKSFLGYGKKTHAPKQGDIVVLKPGRRYHVGFYVGTVMRNGVKYVAVLGGNQSNQVKVTYYRANKVVAYRAT